MEIAMRFKRGVGFFVGALVLNAAVPTLAFAAITADLSRYFQWVDLTACQKRSKAPPPTPQESYAAYNVQRRFVDLDRDGTCEVMDVWIARLGEDPSPGMRVVEQRAFRYRNAKWEKFAIDLKFYPYAIRSTKTKEVFYIEAPSGSDVGDSMAFASQEVRTYTLSGWRISKGALDEYALAPYEGLAGPLLQALAVLLTENLKNAVDLPQKYRVLEDGMKWYRDNQQENIRWILKASYQTLSADKRVPVDAKGLPVQ